MRLFMSCRKFDSYTVIASHSDGFTILAMIVVMIKYCSPLKEFSLVCVSNVIRMS